MSSPDLKCCEESIIVTGSLLKARAYISSPKRFPLLFAEFQSKDLSDHNLQFEGRAYCTCFTSIDVISVFSCPSLKYQCMTISNSVENRTGKRINGEKKPEMFEGTEKLLCSQ